MVSSSASSKPDVRGRPLIEEKKFIYINILNIKSIETNFCLDWNNKSIDMHIFTEEQRGPNRLALAL